VRTGAALVAVSVLSAPVLLGGGLLAAPLLDQPQWLITYAPLAPAALLLVAASGAWILGRPASGEADDRTWSIAARTLWGLAACAAVAFAATELALPQGDWEALARPRGPLALLAAWALSERLDEIQAQLGLRKAGHSTLWDDAGSLSLLLGIPLMARSLLPSIPPAVELLGPLARPISLLLLIGVMVGVARLMQQLIAVARSGDAPDL